MPDVLLHHYDRSPYAEKARAMLGFKGCAWYAVEQPSIMPKPDLTALTGGYRRIPVLQLGADVFCDTRLIAAELDRLQSAPALFPEGADPRARFLSEWVDAAFFWQVAPFVTGCWADDLPDAFLADRAAMSGARSMTRERMKAALPHLRSQIQVALPWLDRVFDSSTYAAGTEPSYHDFALYHCLWFLGGTAPGRELLDPDMFPALTAWVKRMREVGHGDRRAMTPEQAIEQARAAEPRALEGEGVDATGLRPGDRVSVRPERFGTEAVTGVLRAADAERIVVAVDSERAGQVHVHLPRLGQVLTPA